MINEKGEEVGIIYGWYNILTDMWYIGQTIRPEARFKTHIDWAINKKDNNRFHNALRKYGLDNFIYCVLEDNVLKENLNLKEIEWIEYYDSYYCGYNLTSGGDTNYMISKEIRRKLSESHKGKKPWNSGKTNIYSDETKRKQSESHKGKIPWNRRAVSKYDLNGNFIEKYQSIAKAQEENPGCTALGAVCMGKAKQAGGFIWKYA